jgi:hypothetical protein
VPVVAFTYADELLAREVAAADEVTLSLTDDRSTAHLFEPVVIRGRPRLLEDPTGIVFVDELLEQELVRFPPSRVLADSLMLRRENWWYLPRLIVEIDVTALEPVALRTELRDHLLAVGDRGRIEVCPAGFAGNDAGAAFLLDVDGPTAPAAGPAVVFGQDASFPDLERWSQWAWRGDWDGAWFTVREAPESFGLQPAPSLWQRWRQQRDLARRCREAIPES